MTTNANPVNWFEIYVADLPRAKAFYETVLGVRLEKMDAADPGVDGMWMFPGQTGGAGAGGSLVHMPGGPAGGNNSVLVYFRADDCGPVAKRAPAAGGKILKDKFSIGQYGYIAILQDTEGNVFGLHSNA